MLVHAVHGPRRAAGGAVGAGPAVELGAQARRGAAADAGRAGRRLVRRLAVPVWQLEEWRRRGLAGIDAGLRERDDDPKDRQLGEAHRRIGELNMENELLRARMEKPGPLARRRSR
jgi:transposase